MRLITHYREVLYLCKDELIVTRSETRQPKPPRVIALINHYGTSPKSSLSTADMILDSTSLEREPCIIETQIESLVDASALRAAWTKTDGLYGRSGLMNFCACTLLQWIQTWL